MVVTSDGSVQRVNGFAVQLRAFLRLDPCLELSVGGLLVSDIAAHRFGVEAKARNHHAVVACADARVSVGDFACGFEGNFLPKTRQVQHTQRAFGTGTNKRNNFTHKSVYPNV